MDYFKKLKDQFVSHDDMDDEEEYEYEDETPEKTAPVSPSAAVPPRPAAMRSGRSSVPTSQARPYTMVVVNPNDYKDAEKIGDHIKQGHPVVINVEKTDQDIAERIIDFVQGVMYALDGRIDQISDTIYLCAPNNMTVSRENFAAYTAPAAPAVGDVPQWKVPRT